MKMGEYLKRANYGACFHGETWFRCPHCDKAFEFYDTVFERNGIKKTEEKGVFICSCGKKFGIDKGW